jgi:nitrile hydratase beta subunit
MKLQHSLGGLEGLGTISFDRRVFAEDWEQRIFGIHVAMMGLSVHLGEALPRYPIDQVTTSFAGTWTWADLRKGAEAMSPIAYFQYRYYEKWLAGVTEYLLSEGYISEDELEQKTAESVGRPEVPLPDGGDDGIDEQVIRYLRHGDSPRRGSAETPRFGVGDRVTVKDVPATDHTRLPGYLRARTGTVDRRFEGQYRYLCSTGPDGIGDPMPVYAVRFEPADIWGALAEPGVAIYAELYEAYLQPAAEHER